MSVTHKITYYNWSIQTSKESNIHDKIHLMGPERRLERVDYNCYEGQENKDY